MCEKSKGCLLTAADVRQTMSHRSKTWDPNARSHVSHVPGPQPFLPQGCGPRHLGKGFHTTFPDFMIFKLGSWDLRKLWRSWCSMHFSKTTSTCNDQIQSLHRSISTFHPPATLDEFGRRSPWYLQSTISEAICRMCAETKKPENNETELFLNSKKKQRVYNDDLRWSPIDNYPQDWLLGSWLDNLMSGGLCIFWHNFLCRGSGRLISWHEGGKISWIS